MRSKTLAIIAAIVTILAAVALAVAGFVLGSDWSTFIPDLVVGLVGAGLISGVIALVQQRATAHADRRAQQTAAYLELMDAVTEFRNFRPDQDADGVLSRLTTKMILFSELIETDFPSVPSWFEAERRLMLHYVHASMARWPTAGSKAPIEDQLRALEPVFKWTKDFSSNVRLWRSGRLTDSNAVEQAGSIEEQLRAQGAWDEK